MRVLISGFEAFGGRDLNPTALLVQALQAKEISYPQELTVESILLPVSFSEAFSTLQKKMNTFNPDVVICFGLAAGRNSFDLENIALNRIHAEINDNLGMKPQEEKINPLGPESYVSTLPLSGIEGALKAAGVPVQTSNSAGTFVCNYLFYRLMEANQDTLRLCGFIHLPLLPEQAQGDEPSMSFNEMKRGLSEILNYITY